MISHGGDSDRLDPLGRRGSRRGRACQSSCAGGRCEDHRRRVIENAVVVPRQLVEGKTPPGKGLPGHFQGENFVVPL